MASGCPSAFQPPQETIFLWKKPGTSLSDKEQVMMKCGYPSRAGAKYGSDQNTVALMQLCMEKNGYNFSIKKGTYCEIYPNLPACIAADEEKRRGK